MLSAGGDVEWKETPVHCWWDSKLVEPQMETSGWMSSQRLKIEPLYMTRSSRFRNTSMWNINFPQNHFWCIPQVSMSICQINCQLKILSHFDFLFGFLYGPACGHRARGKNVCFGCCVLHVTSIKFLNHSRDTTPHWLFMWCFLIVCQKYRISHLKIVQSLDLFLTGQKKGVLKQLSSFPAHLNL